MNLKHKLRIKKEIKLNKCRYCLTTENLTIDHKIPLSKGGTHELKNLQCLCKRCNGIKGALSHKEMQAFFRFVYEVNEKRALLGKEGFTQKAYEKRKRNRTA